MKNRIIRLGGKDLKVFGFNDEQIVFSSKKHETMESLLESTAKSSMLETVKAIPLSSVSQLDYNDNDESFKIRYLKNGKQKKQTIALPNVEMISAVASAMAEVKGFNKEVTNESKTKPLLLNLLGVVAMPLFTWVLYDIAVDAQNGGHFEVSSGRRRGANQLLVNVVEAIGPTGILIIGAIALLIMLYVTYRRYNNPASEVLFK